MSNNKGIADLKRLTIEFFEMHWNKDKLNAEPPLWNSPYSFKGSVPDHDKQGVYAFVRKDEVIYIGAGGSRSTPNYDGHGLGRRLHGDYLKVSEGGRGITDSERPYEFKDKLWDEVDKIFTLGFKMEHSHLAYALETFLIRNMKPIRNTVQKYPR